ncbi:MAG: copper-binding protein [Alphaproteobacteria bacterium]|nr:copper-binding protein [Alphaproteobacteria bacterium]
MRVLVVLLLLLGGAALAQEEPAVGVGVIHGIAEDRRSLNLTHDPIAAIGWPAMTMDLELAEGAELGELAPDDIVTFTLERGPDRMFRIATIARAAPGTTVAAAADDAPAMDHSAHDHHAMTLDDEGMVMNENRDTLPEDCDAVSGDVEITVRAGRRYAEAYPGTTFGYDRNVFDVEPCARLTVTFINDDQVRHQWMVHGLPRYLYPQGMFHLEAAGKAQKTGTFIVPSDRATYLIHCDMAQHMEKGLRGQIRVGGGDGDIPSIPGLTGPLRPDPVAGPGLGPLGALSALAGLLIGLLALRRRT